MTGLRFGRLRAMLLVAPCGGLVLAGSAQAADSSEFWPELSAYVTVTPESRIYLDASYARSKESDVRTLDLSAFVDISLEPILREQLRTEDWQRSRYLWARLGYTRVIKAEGGTPYVAENRGVAALYAKAPLPAEVWLEGRARVDLRWIDGDYSTRYRFKVEATREFTVREHSVVPYANVEWFYDTRYDRWARTVYQLGTEVTVDKHFRCEVYLARQNDRQPTEQTVNALGLVAKWYY